MLSAVTWIQELGRGKRLNGDALVGPFDFDYIVFFNKAATNVASKHD
jgi:hypothetical protein